MPYKTYKSSGIHPQEPKTLRTLIPDETRYAMLSDYVSGDTYADIGRKHRQYKRQALRTITKAKERAERDNRPLLDIANVQETPGK